MIVIALALAILAPIIAQLIKLAISRKREYLADATGAKLTRYPQGLANALKKTGKPLKLHVCGDTTDRLETFVDAGFDILSLDTKVDFQKAREKVGDRVCLMGNVCPNTTLLFGTTQDVENYSKKVIQQAGLNGKFILSSGCMLSPDTPRENVHAMVNAVEKYGRYIFTS